MGHGPIEMVARQQLAKIADGSFRGRVEALLGLAGIRVNGESPWDIQVNDTRVFRRVLAQGTLGLGDAYMDGW